MSEFAKAQTGDELCKEASESVTFSDTLQEFIIDGLFVRQTQSVAPSWMYAKFCAVAPTVHNALPNYLQIPGDEACMN